MKRIWSQNRLTSKTNENNGNIRKKRLKKYLSQNERSLNSLVSRVEKWRVRRKELKIKKRNTPYFPIPPRLKLGMTCNPALERWLRITNKTARPRRPSRLSICKRLSEIEWRGIMLKVSNNYAIL
jgi:hypothetical protein